MITFWYTFAKRTAPSGPVALLLLLTISLCLVQVVDMEELVEPFEAPRVHRQPLDPMDSSIQEQVRRLEHVGKKGAKYYEGKPSASTRPGAFHRDNGPGKQTNRQEEEEENDEGLRRRAKCLLCWPIIKEAMLNDTMVVSLLDRSRDNGHESLWIVLVLHLLITLGTVVPTLLYLLLFRTSDTLHLRAPYPDEPGTPQAPVQDKQEAADQILAKTKNFSQQIQKLQQTLAGAGNSKHPSNLPATAHHREQSTQPRHGGARGAAPTSPQLMSTVFGRDAVTSGIYTGEHGQQQQQGPMPFPTITPPTNLPAFDEQQQRDRSESRRRKEARKAKKAT